MAQRLQNVTDGITMYDSLWYKCQILFVQTKSFRKHITCELRDFNPSVAKLFQPVTLVHANDL
jgi:hypothetical protein